MSALSDFLKQGLEVVKTDAVKDLVPPVLAFLQSVAKDASPPARAEAIVVLQGQMIGAIASFDKDVAQDLNALLASDLQTLAGSLAGKVPTTT